MPDIIIPISFAEALVGKDGHQSLVALNDHEIKLLEEMRNYIEKRAKIDLDYAEKISKLHSGMRHEGSQSERGSLVENAWKVFLTESENRGITMTEMAKDLQMTLTQRLQKFLSARKEVYRKYNMDRNRMDHSFNCSKDEVKRLSNTYRDALKEALKCKEKLHELAGKGKSGKDWLKAKERFDRTSRKLHQNHNDYILAIEGANEHQKFYVTSMVPFVMETMESIQKNYVVELKDVLMNVFMNTNWCRFECTSSAEQIKQSIDFINDMEEYQSFVEKNKVNPQPVCPFFFDETLLADCPEDSLLDANELVVNDLTYDQLLYKMKTYEGQLDVLQKDLKTKEDALGRIETDLIQMEAARETTASLIIIEKRTQLYNLKREMEELRCKDSVTKLQYTHVKTKLDELGDRPPPAYSSIEAPSGPFLYPEQNADSKKGNSRTLPFMFSRKKKGDVTSRLSYNGDNTKSLSAEERVDGDDSDVGEYCDPEDEEGGLDSQAWFHGKLERVEVPRLIKQNGDFLVREKSDGSGSVVSVMVSGQIKHFILKPTDEGKYKFEGDSFDTIDQLINHHYHLKIPIQSANSVMLNSPIRKAFVKGDKFSFSHSEVTLEGKLGSGHFGDVYRGILVKKNLPVAIKTCRENVDETVKRKFLAEAEIMKPYNHKNVMKLIGVCNDKEPYYILMELLPNGDLLNYLKKEGTHFKTAQLLRMAADAAAGMEYLECKNTIHRDLAARNCLVGENNVVKISDFGMSREEDDEGIYTIQTTKEIPIKWTAPEVWQYQQYTTKSDVWSFGVLLYEIFSLGNTPYPGWSNKQAREKIEVGYRMPAPTGTPSLVYEVMQRCWQYDPTARPHFHEVNKKLQSACKSNR